MANSDLFWTPAPDSDDIRIAAASLENRWRDAITQPTQAAQHGLGSAIGFCLLIALCALLAEALPLGEPAAFDRFGIARSLIMPACVLVLLPLLFAAIVFRTSPYHRTAVLVRSSALTLGSLLLGVCGCVMLWNTFGPGLLAAALIGIYLLALALGCASVLRSWRPRLAATLAGASAPRASIGGGALPAVLVSSVSLVVFKLLLATAPDTSAAVASALICAIACYIIAWLIAMGMLNVIRVLIALNLVR